MLMAMELDEIMNGMTNINFIPCLNKDEDAFLRYNLSGFGRKKWMALPFSDQSFEISSLKI